MFIETALKNIALNTIMSEIDSSSIYDMYDKAISSYKNAPAGTREDIKKKYQNNKLNLQGSIQNAIAHNDVVYDTRFKKMDPSRPMKQCLILEMGDAVHKFQDYRRLHYPYLLLLKLLKVSKTEIKSSIREFEKITREYGSSVNPNVSAISIHPDLFSRLNILKNSI